MDEHKPYGDGAKIQTNHYKIQPIPPKFCKKYNAVNKVQLNRFKFCFEIIFRKLFYCCPITQFYKFLILIT